MNKRFLWGLILLGLAVPASYACNSIQFVQSAGVLAETQTDIVLLVRRKNRNDVCQYAIAVNKGNINDGTYNRYLALSGTSFRIPVQYWKQNMSEILKDFPDTTAPTSVLFDDFRFLDPTSRQETLRVVQDLGGVGVRAGLYSNTFGIKLYKRNLNGSGSWALVQNLSHPLSFTNPPQISTSVVDPGAPYQEGDNFQLLDFGEIQSGEAVGFDLMVRNNKSFQFSVSSANGGFMVHQTGGTEPAKKIQYRLVLAATAHNPQTVISSFPYQSATISPSIGVDNRFPFTAEVVETMTGKRAGNYSDQVTINFTAL